MHLATNQYNWSADYDSSTMRSSIADTRGRTIGYEHRSASLDDRVRRADTGAHVTQKRSGRIGDQYSRWRRGANNGASNMWNGWHSGCDHRANMHIAYASSGHTHGRACFEKGLAVFIGAYSTIRCVSRKQRVADSCQ